MAAANKGSPIQLEGPFPEGAMGPLTQRPRQLIQKPWPTFPRRVYMAASKQYLAGYYWQAVSKHRASDVNKTAIQLLPNRLFTYFRVPGRQQKEG